MSELIKAKRLNIDQDLSFNNNKLTNLADPTAATDAANRRFVQMYVDQYVKNGVVKKPVVAATATNFTSGAYVIATDTWTGVATAPVVDGVTITNGQRILIKNAVDARGCGVWVYNSVSTNLTRATDFDNKDNDGVPEVYGGVIVPVQRGTVNNDKIYELSEPNEAVVLGTDALVFVEVNPSFAGGSKPTTGNKNQSITAGAAPSGTIAADASPTGISLQAIPVQGSYVAVSVDGVLHTVGEQRTGSAFFFSANLGVTAKTFNNLAAGDQLCVNPSILGYNLDAADRIDIYYNV